MKKIILVAAMLMVSASAAFSQGIDFGAKAGLNLAKISNIDDAKMRPGFYAGVFAEAPISNFFGLSAELLYSQMGAKEEYDGEKATIKLDYLALPVLAKLYVAEGLSLDVGPQFGFLMSAKGKYEYEGESETEDIKEDFNGFDVSAGIGLTYNIGRFMIQGRYNLGLTDVMKDNDSDDKFKNNVIQVGVGFRF